MTKQYSWKNVIGYATAIEELKKYGKEKQGLTEIIINKYLKIVINIVIKNAFQFSIRNRLKIVQHSIIYKNIKLIQFRTMLVFLFKSFIRK